MPLTSYNNHARVYSQLYFALSGYDTGGTIGEAGPFPNTYFVEQGDSASMGGGFVSFSRTFAELPSGFNDYETYTYTFPALTTYRTQQKTATVVARVYNDFFITGSPQDITLSGAQRYLNTYGWDVTMLSFGAATTPNVTTYAGWSTSGIELIPEDASISRFIGPIWRRETKYVRAQ